MRPKQDDDRFPVGELGCYEEAVGFLALVVDRDGGGGDAPLGQVLMDVG